MIMNDIISAILKGEFDEASSFDNRDTDEVIRNMCEVSFDNQSITFYGFSIFMYQKTRNLAWLEAAVSILCFSMNFIEGAYALALRHQREILEHERSIENLQMLLFFYKVPDVDFSKEEAISVVKEILSLDPSNKLVNDSFPDLVN